MADGYEVKLNLSGFRELRRLPEVEADLLRRGEAIARACGDGYRAEASPGRNRARVTVFPDTFEAMNSEAQHNHLLKNLDAGR